MPEIHCPIKGLTNSNTHLMVCIFIVKRLFAELCILTLFYDFLNHKTKLKYFRFALFSRILSCIVFAYKTFSISTHRSYAGTDFHDESTICNDILLDLHNLYTDILVL